MKIQILEKRNIFYIYLIINLLGYTDDNGFPMHSLRKKSVSDFQKYIDNEKLLKLKEIYNTKKIYNSYLIDYALYSPEGFSEILFNQKRFDKRFQKTKGFQRHIQFMELARDVILELNIIEYYEKNIHPYISELCNRLNTELVELDIDDAFKDFFGFTLEKDGKIYPNILEAYSRAYGFEIEDSVVSVFGFNSLRDNDLDFSIDSGVQNLIHEFTHFYFDRVKEKYKEVIKSKEYKLNAKLSFKYLKNKLKETDNLDVLEHYDNWDYYLEENIVRAITYKILVPNVFKNVWSDKEVQDYISKRFENIENSGFYLVDNILKYISDDVDWESIFMITIDNVKEK